MNEETKETTEVEAEVVDETEEDAPELPAEVEPWEMQERIEELIASGKGSEYAKNEYYYSFKKGSKTVRGLTAPAYAHLALIEGVSIEEMEVTGFKTGYEANAIAVKLSTGQRAYGTAFQPYNDSNGLDIFSKQKAMTKAARNARKQLIPFERVVTAISQLAGIPNTLPPASQQQQLPPSQQGNETAEQERERKQKEMFAVFRDRETDLVETHGIGPFTFWAGVKVKCGIFSPANMSTAQIQMVVTALRNEELPQWILNLKAPNAKIKLLAVCEEYKAQLPEDVWEQFQTRTGVKDPVRLTIGQAKSCYELVCNLLRWDVPDAAAPDGDSAPTAKTDEADDTDTHIPF